MTYQNLIKTLSVMTASLFITCSAWAGGPVTAKANDHQKHFYAGATVGYGRTTWKQLDATDDVVELSVPKESRDFGTTWGVFLGYQFTPAFSVEARYMRYPNTRIKLDKVSFYLPLTGYTTHTQVFAAIGKFMIPIYQTNLSAFLDAGVALTHRNDVLTKVTRVAPTFGMGINFTPTSNIITELGFEYYIGYGKSDKTPLKDFVPFLYGVYFSVGYRIG